MWNKATLGGVVMLVAGLGIAGLNARTGYAAWHGHDLTATVTRCDSHYTGQRKTTTGGTRGESRTVCYGTWRTADGRTHQGEITGTSDADLHRQVKVAAVDDTTAEHESLGDAAREGVIGLLIAAFGGFVLVMRGRPAPWRR